MAGGPRPANATHRVVRPQVIQRASDDFPPLGAALTKEKQKEIKEQSRAALELSKAKAAKEKEQEESRLIEIERLGTREEWWRLLYLDEGTAYMKVRNNYGKVGGVNVHVSVYKGKTTNVNFKSDSVAAIVDKIIGGADDKDTVHTTLELYGKDDVSNPRYFRNGDSPNCTEDQKTALQDILHDFIIEATTLVTDKKTRLNP
jgi:hypothetical protein